MNKKLFALLIVIVVAVVLFGLFVLPSLLPAGNSLESIFGMPAAGTSPPALPE